MRAPLEGTAKLLARRSIFFPDLAADKNALTHLQKLELATDNSIAPSMVLGDLISAGTDQATNSLKGYGQEYGGFGKRLGSALATSTTNQYFKTFLLPTVLQEDPRYFALLRGTTENRVWYAITRVVVTQTDTRTEAINWSGIVGSLMAEGLANVYLPSEERTVGRTRIASMKPLEELYDMKKLRFKSFPLHDDWDDYLSHMGECADEPDNGKSDRSIPSAPRTASRELANTCSC